MSGGISVGRALGLAITAGESVAGQVRDNDTEIALVVWDATTGATEMQASELSADGELGFFGEYLT